MTDKRRPLIAGNWKMNGLKASANELAAIGQGAEKVWRKADLLICPPATLLFTSAAIVIGSKVAIGAQDCHPAASGAHTGGYFGGNAGRCGRNGNYRRSFGAPDRSPRNRRAGPQQSRGGVACRAGCDRLRRRNAGRTRRGKTLDVVGQQLAGSVPDGSTAANLVVAYEPVWAIGTGRTPTTKDVEEVHKLIRDRLRDRFSGEGASVRILYGGSVKPSNAAELMAVANVDGALVGGASLKAVDFLAIAAACP
jgi:triosephosphate isomerase